MINRQFANFATRVSFNLTLTKAQVYYLWVIKERQWTRRNDDAAPVGAPEAPAHEIFVPTYRALRERGLVVQKDPDSTWSSVLTPEGEHVYALLVASGLVPSHQKAKADA